MNDDDDDDDDDDNDDDDEDDGEVRDAIHPHPASFCLTQPTPLLRTDHCL